jgi:5-methylcytosine-specific restriction endonuclease McrA
MNDPNIPLYVRGKCVCIYCGFDGKQSVLTWHQLVIDHVIPLRCKQSLRKNSPLNVDVNKVVACLKCNDVKRSWDKKYEDGLPENPSPERVARALQSATEHIRRYYADIDADFETTMTGIAP